MQHSVEEVIQRLVEGNRRFVAGKPLHPNESEPWRQKLEAGQHPFATILGCSDSRVPIELLFDQGFGDLFVIRLAGNVVSTEAIGSIEYAVNHLHTTVVLVLGHENCGAVTAALSPESQRQKEPPEVQSLLKSIQPALKDINPTLAGDEQLHAAVEANVRLSMDRLSEIPDLKESLDGGKFKIIGGIYSLATGEVRLLD
jgi:carbonic anhydrase